MDIAVFDALQAARQAKQPVALVTDLASGGQCLLGDDGQVIGASAGAPNLTACRRIGASVAPDIGANQTLGA